MANNIKLLNQPSLAQVLGQGLGTGLSSGLQALAQQKLGQMASRQLLPNLSSEVTQQNLSQMLNQQTNQPTFQQALNQLLNPEESQQFKIPENLPATQAGKLADIALKQKTSQEKAATAEQARIDKETQKRYDEILGKGAAAKSGFKRLDRMKVLIEEGNLPDPDFYNILSHLNEFGSTIPYVGPILNTLAKPFALLARAGLTGANREAMEEYDKLSNEFIREAKSIFGSRVTDQDLRAFMKLVPTLSQSDPGKLAIVRNIENVLKADQVKEKAAKQVIRENRGKRPADFDAQVNKKSKRRLDFYADKFAKGESIRPTPAHKPRTLKPREEARQALQNALSSISPGLASLIEGL